MKQTPKFNLDLFRKFYKKFKQQKLIMKIADILRWFT
jgi:hypothetical protein